MDRVVKYFEMVPKEPVRGTPKIPHRSFSFSRLCPSAYVPKSWKLTNFLISMSADAAFLPCPVCSHTGIFDSVQTLRDRLISVSTNTILCPVCQDEVTGLDKLTIHLFTHVKFITKKTQSETQTENAQQSETSEVKNKQRTENQGTNKTQQKRAKPSTSKNKPPSTANVSVKFVKIFPKLPVISVNTLPVIDLSRAQPLEECTQAGGSIYVPTVKTETSLTQTNTTCNICGLQFVDANILRMHRCLIHNIDDNSNINSTRFHCHLCPKNFKMRGSLMVHLRVAHYGFAHCNSETNKEKNKEEKNSTDDKPIIFDRNDSKQWQCDVCRKCFTTKYFLKKHKRLHTGETPYACTQCNKTFTFQQSYHKHLLYHNDEKPHTCSYCGRSFKELSTLHNHQRIHTGEKPFSCETCGKCFRQRVSYLVHRRIHTGAMPYKCTACEKSFRYKVSQRTHKCQAQPPGTVVRQTGDLIEKLRKRNADEESTPTVTENILNKYLASSLEHNNCEKQNYLQVSEANAELARRGANLSLEDMESENFTLLNETFKDNTIEPVPSTSYASVPINNNSAISSAELFNSNLEDLIDSIPTNKNVPSPSEILKNLCLSKDEDYSDADEAKYYNTSKLLNNVFL